MNRAVFLLVGRNKLSAVPATITPTIRRNSARLVTACAALVAVGCMMSSRLNAEDCPAAERLFAHEVWAKVAERHCVRCHHADGDAAESQFILLPLTITQSTVEQDAALRENRLAFEKVAKQREDGQSRLLLKATGKLDHGGGEVLKNDSTAYKLLHQFVESDGTQRPPDSDADLEPDPPLFADVTMLSPTRLLRRTTLSLCGRLPSAEELVRVAQEGNAAIAPILDQLMSEEAFYKRLQEGFNDIFLTIGIEDNAETILSYDHFEHSRLWYQKHDLSPIPEAEQERARWKLADVYREALLREPLELITHIVRHNRPFTELVTADYIMVSPYTARGYGIFDELKDQFENPDDPFEYIPARLKALKNRAGKIQESATGMYPHAGLLSTFHYLRRYPSTETNRNRLRARMVYQHFLGIDVMALAPRSSDASAIAEQFEVPTMQAADCVVCHRTIDPLAGLFQDFDFEGHLGPRKDGWYTDMFAAGFEGESMPADQRWRAPQWLGERIARDRRFAVAMVEHVYWILFGRKVLLPPDDIDDPSFTQRRTAYREQRRLIESIADRFTRDRFNLKSVFNALILSDFYRVDGLKAESLSAARRAALDDLGVVRLLSPEQLERKLAAVFGKPWNRLDGETKILYGGIDSITVTERNADPSGAMGAIQRIMANDVACYHVAHDFRKPAAERLLFADIEPDVVPGNDEADDQIRHTIVSLDDRILGQEHSADHEEVTRTFELFRSIVDEARSNSNFEKRETYYCGGREEFHTDDPNYTIRAWRAVVTYLLRQHEFLYE